MKTKINEGKVLQTGTVSSIVEMVDESGEVKIMIVPNSEINEDKLKRTLML